MSVKHATPAYPVNDLITKRWSPYAFASKPVPEADLRSLFEAARWAASSYNEQPWRYIVATQADAALFQKILGCLWDANQGWAKQAPVLALGVVSHKFAYNGKDNRAAIHDLGQASANLSLEATARGLVVHQMIGVHPDQARVAFAIPADYEVYTALAIGYLGDPNMLPDAVRPRDLSPRTRKPLQDFVFGGTWGTGAALTGK